MSLSFWSVPQAGNYVSRRQAACIKEGSHQLHNIISSKTLKLKRRLYYYWKTFKVTVNRLVILALAVCAIYTAQGSGNEDITDKKDLRYRNESFRTNSARISPGDLSSNVHTRKRRSEGRSYVLFDNRSKKTVQLWWRDLNDANGKWMKFGILAPDSPIQIDTFVNNKWTAVADDDSAATFRINGKEHYTPTSNTMDTRTICIITSPGQKNTKVKRFVETLVVVDKSVRDRFDTDDEAKKYVQVLLSLATTIYKHNYLTQHGLRINIATSKVIIQNEEMKFDPSKREDNVYLACEVMNKLGNNGAQRFDHKLYLTKNQFGAGGYARRGGMCSQYSSCSIVLDHGFHAAFLIAHEIGHSFGLSHVDYGQYSRYIMAGIPDGLFHNHRWSPKSQQALLANIRKYTCLRNRPNEIKKYKYPGLFYSFEKQCDLEFDEGYTAWQPSRWQPGDPCKRLKCNMPGKWYTHSRTTGSPALDGTKCGENKWCLLGQCQDKMSVSVIEQY